MKVTFLHFVIDVMASFSHSIASLASIIERGGHDVNLIVLKSQDFRNYAHSILTSSPDIVCMSVTSNQWSNALSLSKILKRQKPDLTLWVGGSHINAVPMDFLSGSFDAACYGEGEELLPQALAEFEKGFLLQHPSWLTRESNPPKRAAVIQNLDSLPLPKYAMFDPKDILNYPSVMFSRGCPYKCSYCMSRLGGIGGRVRWKSVDRAISEVRRLIIEFNPEEINFDDDAFLKDTKWAARFLKKYKEEIGLPFYCNTRPEEVTPWACELLADSGCDAIGIGIESGVEHIRRKTLFRPISNKIKGVCT